MYTLKTICTGLVLIMSMFTTSSYAENTEWELKKDKKGVKVYVAKLGDSSFLSFRAVSVMKTNINSLVNLMRDMSAMESWLETCRDPKVVEEPDEATRIIHMKNDSPFFLVSHRDLVLVQRFRRVSDDVLMVDLEDRGDTIPPVDGYVRGEFNGHWKFTQLSDSAVEVEYYGLTDPRGSVPAMFANMAVLDVPYNTLIKIRKILHDKETKYNRQLEISSL